MKKYILIIVLSIISLNLYSQNHEPQSWEFVYGTNLSQRVFNPDDFLQTKMLFGFQWSASKNMNDTLGFLCSSQHFINECYDEYRKVILSFYYVDDEICKSIVSLSGVEDCIKAHFDFAQCDKLRFLPPQE